MRGCSRWNFTDGPPDTSNYYCLPGRAGGSPADVSMADPREHFLGSLIVSHLSSNMGVRDNDGFISGQSILVEMAKNGFIDDQVRHSLRKLATKRLIETPHAHFREIAVPEHEAPEQFYFRATSVGIYHVRFWTGSFAFLDATSIDTPIFAQESCDKIKYLASSFDIADRYTKSTAFRSYLENQWFSSNIGANYYNFPLLLRNQDHTFAAVKAFIDKGSPRRNGRRQYSRTMKPKQPALKLPGLLFVVLPPRCARP